LRRVAERVGSDGFRLARSLIGVPVPLSNMCTQGRSTACAYIGVSSSIIALSSLAEPVCGLRVRLGAFHFGGAAGVGLAGGRPALDLGTEPPLVLDRQDGGAWRLRGGVRDCRDRPPVLAQEVDEDGLDAAAKHSRSNTPSRPIRRRGTPPPAAAPSHNSPARRDRVFHGHVAVRRPRVAACPPVARIPVAPVTAASYDRPVFGQH
jgi:hypothetical protein